MLDSVVSSFYIGDQWKAFTTTFLLGLYLLLIKRITMNIHPRLMVCTRMKSQEIEKKLNEHIKIAHTCILQF